MPTKLEKIMDRILDEFAMASNHYKKFNSLHEGYAVLLEEVDELWEEIKKKDKNIGKIKNEAIQVATMAIRLIYDCGDG